MIRPIFARRPRPSGLSGRSLALLLTVAALAGCERSRKPVAIIPPPAAPASLPLFRPAIEAREDLPAIVRANNAFAVSLYQKLRDRPGNLLVSPACLSAGLALLHAGARGETAEQIARVLHLPGNLAHPDRAHAALIRALNADAEDRSYQIRLANAAWIQEGQPLLDSYRSTVEDVFAAGCDRVDFTGHPAEACRTINAWTESRTGGKLAGMLRPADLPSRTRLVLTTGLFLRANWRRQFHRESTRPESFRVSAAESIDAPMMHDHSYSSIQGYFDGGTFQALDLPCGTRGEFAMTVLLPREVDGLADLEASLTPEALASWWPRFRRPEEIIIALPKYRIRADLMLAPLLSALGMPAAFAEGRADFSGIDGKGSDLYLAAARHATLLDVNEEGIEAAAVTHFINPDAFGEEPPVIRADHPFLFLIRDTRSGCVIFLGRVANPLDQGGTGAGSEEGP
ncbi:serpin family protein [Tundrisphaera sp. TA3]|uniref:serpin family protein n=1 Tax=Tundrisphaera sp. TA3 TaxID=3435775 RepID=UPI003EBB7807